MNKTQPCPSCGGPLTREPFDYQNSTSQIVSVCHNNCILNDGTWNAEGWPTPLHNIPTDELQADIAQARADLLICFLALKMDITHYEGESVAERMASNQKVVDVIRAELTRRGQ